MRVLSLAALAVLVAGCSAGASFMSATGIGLLPSGDPDQRFGYVVVADAVEWHWFEQEHNVPPVRHVARYELIRGGRRVGMHQAEGDHNREIKHRVIAFETPEGQTISDLPDGDYEIRLRRMTLAPPQIVHHKHAQFTVSGGALVPYAAPSGEPDAPRAPDGAQSYPFADVYR